MNKLVRPVLSFGLSFSLCFFLSASQSLHAQPAWLTDPGMPSVPSEGLLEPPPPLQPEMPASVFEQAPVEIAEPEYVYRPIWYYPWTWLPLDGWENSAELGINGAEGNAQSLSFQTGARFKRKTDLNLFDFRISHNRTQANSVETQNNALFFGDYERFIGDSPWTFFVKNGLEYDEFRAFDIRYNLTAGLGYSFFRTDDLTLVGRFGAGTSREFGGPDDRWVPEALFGFDYEHQVNARNKLIARVDYFPDWSDFSNFRLVSDTSWEYLLDADGNLSFKLGAVNRHDSTPNGAKPNDLAYNALLLYKF